MFLAGINAALLMEIEHIIGRPVEMKLIDLLRL
jgi:hypothetical protein